MEIFYADTAVRQLKSLECNIRDRIIKKVHLYASQPDPLEFAEPLTGLTAYRFRIGDYRVVFQREQHLIHVLSVRRRDEAY
jgi:mRNA-degrading endonuclease RelE of RelBE toxin-antitoxin system